MKAENYKISKLSYIENGSNEIMERYQIHTKYETEPPHGDAIYSISIKGLEKRLTTCKCSRRIHLPYG